MYVFLARGIKEPVFFEVQMKEIAITYKQMTDIFLFL